MASHYYYIKLYNEILDDPKMGRLSDKAFRLCINLFLLANRQDERDGRLPDFEDIAWMLRLSMDEFQPLWDELERANIVEVTESLPFVTHFEKRQEKQSDAEKQKRYRQRKRQQTLPDSDTPVTDGVTNGNTEVDKNRKDKSKKESREEGTPQPPNDDEYDYELWETAVSVVDRWKKARGTWRKLDPHNAKDKDEYFAPVLGLVVDCNGDGEKAWGMLEGQYQRMIADGLTPVRAGPVVEQIYAAHERALQGPASSNGNGAASVAADYVRAKQAWQRQQTDN